MKKKMLIGFFGGLLAAASLSGCSVAVDLAKADFEDLVKIADLASGEREHDCRIIVRNGEGKSWAEAAKRQKLTLSRRWWKDWKKRMLTCPIPETERFCMSMNVGIMTKRFPFICMIKGKFCPAASGDFRCISA